MTSDNSVYVASSLRGNNHLTEVPPPSVYMSQSLRGAHLEKRINIEQLFNVKPAAPTSLNQDKDTQMMSKISLPEMPSPTNPLPARQKDLTKRSLPTPPKGNTPPNSNPLAELTAKPFAVPITIEGNCPICSQSFSKARRRFVCRVCNSLFCIDCTNRVMVSLLPNEDPSSNELVRVCTPCYSTAMYSKS